MKFKTILISTIFLAAISGLFYVLFNQYLTTVGHELVQSWLKSEENLIREGNLLSSATKTQKVLLTSEFMKGIAVYDLSQAEPRSLVEFGQKPSVAKAILVHEIEVISEGFLKKTIVVRVPGRQDLAIAFSIWSAKMNGIYIFTLVIFLILSVILNVTVLYFKKREQKQVEAFAKKAEVACHDLAQPIMALNSLADQLDESTDTQTTIKSVVARIDAIVDDLSSRKKIRSRAHQNEVATSLNDKIESLIKEKQICAGKNINLIGKINCPVRLSEDYHDTLLRALANLIDNSIEACANKGEIEVLVSEDDANIKIEVRDSGMGIPTHVLASVGQERFTFGKEHGTGLGVFNTKKFIEGLGGSFTITSKEEVGTEVVMTWPKQTQKKLFLAEDTKLLVLDDDPLCHAAWRNFFKQKEVTNPVEYFFSADKLKSRLEQLKKDDVFIFSDFHLKDATDGLQVLSANDLTSQSALVTAHFDEPTVKARARKLGVPVFDKAQLATLPLEFV